MDSKIKHILLCIFISVFAVQIQAQTPCCEGQEGNSEQPRKILSPDRIAKKETDRLKKALDLTDKQYDKIYKLNLKEQRKLFEANMERKPVMPAPGMNPGQHRSHGEGMPPAGMGNNRPEGMRDGRPGRDMAMHRPPMGNMPEPETIEDIQKFVKKKNKKMKKILTESQYDLWLGMNQPRPAHPDKCDKPKKGNKDREDRNDN